MNHKKYLEVIGFGCVTDFQEVCYVGRCFKQVVYKQVMTISKRVIKNILSKFTKRTFTLYVLTCLEILITCLEILITCLELYITCLEN